MSVIADYKNQKVHWQPTYYYMGHFSRFIVPQSKRVFVSDGPLLLKTAFVTPNNQIVVVVMNQRDFGLDFKLQDGDYEALCYIPAHAIQTYVYDKLF
jgi:glucosylceramidase